MAASILYGVATYFYYEKEHRMMHTAIVSNLLKLAGIACAPRPIHATKITFGVKFTLNLFKEAFKMWLKSCYNLCHKGTETWRTE